VNQAATVPERVTLGRSVHGIRRKDDPTDEGVGPWNVIATEKEADYMRHVSNNEVCDFIPESAHRESLERIARAQKATEAQLNDLRGAIESVLPQVSPQDWPNAWDTDLLTLKAALDRTLTLEAQEARTVPSYIRQQLDPGRGDG
jgi:hypothetical protein